jgi:hypothetical protein
MSHSSPPTKKSIHSQRPCPLPQLISPLLLLMYMALPITASPQSSSMNSVSSPPRSLAPGSWQGIRYPTEKNNDNFDAPRAAAFNLAIHNMSLMELPLLDRAFSWSNQRTPPVLARLDMALFNADFDAAAPNTTLSSLSHATSDHTPLHITIDTSIPKSHNFRFEKCLAPRPLFPAYDPTNFAG